MFNGMPNDRQLMPIFYTTYTGDETIPAGNAINYDPGVTFICEAPTKL